MLAKLLLSSLLLFSSFCSFAQTATLKPLRILTWNIYMLPKIVPMAGRMERAEKIIDTLQNSDIDVIVFQEAFHQKAQAKLADGLKETFPYMYGPFNLTNKFLHTNSGVWVVSKSPLKVIDTIEFEAKSGIDKMARKGAVLLEGMYNGKAYQILGTHMQSDYKPAVRAKQFGQMYTELIQKYKQDSVPQILCGDMNTEWSYKEDYQQMLTLLDAKDGLIDGIQQETYDGFTNKIVETSWKRAKTNYDYILLKRNNAKISSVKRQVSVLRSRWSKKHHDLSDHYGLICELIF